MHELSIVLSLVGVAERAANEAGVPRVRRIEILVGELRAVEPHALASCFAYAAEGTICEGATLDIETVPARGTCPACGSHSPIVRFRVVCPRCGFSPMSVVAGNELHLARILGEPPLTGGLQQPCDRKEDWDASHA